MRSQKRAAKVRGTPKKTSKQTRMNATHPPPFTAQSIRKIKVRTTASQANTNTAFLHQELSSILGIVGTGATTSNYLTNVFRLTKISMWGPVATAGTPVTCAVTWTETGTDYETPPTTKSDTSISFDHPAFVSCKPPAGSLASKWHNSGSTVEMCALTYPAGATVDFTFEWVMTDLAGPTAGPTIAGGTAGNFYHKIVHNLTAVIVNAL